MDASHLRLTERRRAVTFIVLIGCVSLFADMTYEGARSTAGPFLGMLGASALVVSVVSGLGEFFGYGVRYLSGRAGDRSGRYWTLMMVGTPSTSSRSRCSPSPAPWPIAVILLIAERIGRAIRAPIRSAMLSHAASRTGAGWAFGLHTALDQTGGMTGPLLVALLLALGTSYKYSFATLLLPALLSLGLLLTARRLNPDPRRLELRVSRLELTAWSGFERPFRLYTLAAALVSAGFADFALIAFHLTRAHVIPAPGIPLLYAVAMATEGVSALVLGRLLDHLGPRAALAGIVPAALSIPLVFLGGFAAAIAGAALWGVGMAIQDTIFHAVLSALIPPTQRATAYGLFDALRGSAWLGGSILLGILYGTSLRALAAISVLLQMSAIPVFLLAGRSEGAA